MFYRQEKVIEMNKILKGMDFFLYSGYIFFQLWSVLKYSENKICQIYIARVAVFEIVFSF